MSLLNSLFSGVSGIRNHQSMMDNIGNNIANVNTIGYKSTRITFSDTFNQFIRFGSDPTSTGGGTNAFQIGLGMKVNSIDRDWNQGTFERTGIKTDLALQGDALFVLENNGTRFYSRAGAFSFDSSGNLVNNQNGAIVLGKMATSQGAIPPGNNLEKIVIDTNMKLPAIATTETSWGGNLDSASSITRTENYVQSGNLNGATAVSGTITEQNTIYDIKGNAYTLKSTYTKTAADNWTLNLTLTDSDGNDVALDVAGNPSTAASPYNIATVFDPTTNKITSFNGASPASAIAIQANGGEINFNFDATRLTQIASTTTLASTVDDNREPTNVNSTLSIYDSLGKAHSLSLKFTKIADNIWQWAASVPPESGTLNSGFEGTISFNKDGSIATVSPQNPPVVSFAPAGGAEAQNIRLDFGSGFDGITQTSSNSVVSALSQNGSESAQLSDMTIDQYGFIKGVFSNGQSRKLAQILLAKFPNLNGLTSVGENMYVTSANAGTPVIGDPGEATGTTIQSGALEQSNVDLSEQFTKMIVSQRGFQANARVVTVSDQLLQEITNLVR